MFTNAHPAITATIALALLSCGNTVEVDGATTGAGGGTIGDCVVCNGGGITLHRWKGIPFCPGEREKYDALVACACSEDTCLQKNVCTEAPSKVASNFCDELNQGSESSDCQQCMVKNCKEAYVACGCGTLCD